MTNQKEQKKIQVQAKPTPNPHSMQFKLNQNIATGHWETSSQAKSANPQVVAQDSPLAQKIMGFPWVDKVFIGPNFITINKQDWVEWDTLIEPLSDMIREHIETGQVVLNKRGLEKGASFKGSPSYKQEQKALTKHTSPADSEIIQKIKQILEKEIQPAVAMDGGFIAFTAYEKGRVFLKMQGACSGCPSASLTLKQGIERHLKNQIPLIQEVVAL